MGSSRALPTGSDSDSTDDDCKLWPTQLKKTLNLSIDLGTLTTGPSHPNLKRYPVTKFGDQNRAFTSSLYTTYDFIEYSILKDSIFCFPCRIFNSGSGYKDPAFTANGVCNWKNVREKTEQTCEVYSSL